MQSDLNLQPKDRPTGTKSGETRKGDLANDSKPKPQPPKPPAKPPSKPSGGGKK